MKGALAVLIALWSAASVPAQAGADKETARTVQRMHEYGRCVVDNSPSDSRRVLARAPGSREERSLLHAISILKCLNGHGGLEQIDFQPEWLRGLVAEEVLRRDRAGERVRGSDRMAPFTGLTAADIAALDEKGRRTLRGLDFAQCVEAAAPKAVEQLLATEPTSAEEGRAFGALVPYLGPCLPSGAEASIVRPQLRGFLAEAAYRAAFAPGHAPK